MSKIGNKPITIPEGVIVEIKEDKIRISGPKGNSELNLPPEIIVSKEPSQLIIKRSSNSKKSRALHGLYRSLINNIVFGVTQGYKKDLIIQGLGYRVSLSQTEDNKQKLVFSLGYSHPLEIEAPDGILFAVNKNIISVSGTDKQLVGEIAARIRALKKPEPYKGKGIRYANETIIRKPGKAVVKKTGSI